LAGLDLVAEVCHSAPTPDALRYFSQTALPELSNTALTSDSPEHRLSAVMILQRADTEQARSVLQLMAQSSADPQVVEAAQVGLQGRSPKP
jgi:hypothetical protein